MIVIYFNLLADKSFLLEYICNLYIKSLKTVVFVCISEWFSLIKFPARVRRQCVRNPVAQASQARAILSTYSIIKELRGTPKVTSI